MKFPVSNGRITQKFSSRHLGIDIAPPRPGQTGVACVSPEGGVVQRSGYRVSVEGNYVILKGKSGKYHYFGHFASRNVKVGQSVKEGQKIGVLGQTGLATAIHTHYEYRRTLTGGQINPGLIKWKDEDVYKGHSAKYWYTQYVHKDGVAKTWRARFDAVTKKLKGLVGK